MNAIPKIEMSRWNHGEVPEIVCTVTTAHEVAFKPEDIVRVLMAAASNDMAKVINAIGAVFNMDQFAEAYAADALNEVGREFIDNMYFFLHSKDGECEPGFCASSGEDY